MADLLDVEDLIDNLNRANVTPEELIGRAIRELYGLKEHHAFSRKLYHRNKLRAVIAYIKVMYDFGQKMLLANVLLHRIKLIEVRDEDQSTEISYLRGNSSDENRPSNKELDDFSTTGLPPSVEVDSMEDMIMDCAERVRTIDRTQRSLSKLSGEISRARILLEDTNSTSRTDLTMTTGATMDLERGRSPPLEKTNHYYFDMAVHKEKDMKLLSQEDFGNSSGRHSGAVPGAALSSSNEGNPCADAVAALGDSITTAENLGAQDTALPTSPDDHREECPPTAAPKRKAVSSPEENPPGNESEAGFKRPTKARIIVIEEAKDSEPILIESDDTGEEDMSIAKRKQLGRHPLLGKRKGAP